MNSIFKIGVLVMAISNIFHLYTPANKIISKKEPQFSRAVEKQARIQSASSLFGLTLMPVKSISGDIAGLSDDDINRLMKSKLKIERDYLVFFGDSMLNPSYELHVENSFDFIYTNYNITPDRLGILEDSVQVLSATFNGPLATVNFLFFNKTIILQNEGVFFFLEKRLDNSLHKIPSAEDTVRCLYNEDKTCTGFVIQGTRKAGKVVHVKPANKNVPLEIDEK